MRLATFIVVVALALGAAVVGTLVVTGAMPLPWARRTPERPLAPGSALCPVTVRDVQAYSAVVAEDLVDPQSGQKRLEAVSAATLASADPPLRDVRQIVDRVLRVDLPPGTLFHKSDFYPAGTRRGAAAGVPVGKRAITLDAAAVTGSRDLRAGDHVDLDAAQGIAMDPSRMRVGGVAGGLPPMSVKVAAVQPLARDGVVVQPLTIRQVPYQTSGGLTGTAQTRTKPIEEVTIAVDPTEAAAVEQAVATGATISCLLHSGQPTTSPASTAVDHGTGMPQFAPVEQIVGDKHSVKYVPLPEGHR